MWRVLNVGQLKEGSPASDWRTAVARAGNPRFAHVARRTTPTTRQLLKISTAPTASAVWGCLSYFGKMAEIPTLRSRHGQRLLKHFQTCNLLMAGVSMGLVLVMIGPTLLDLADVLHVSIQQMTWITSGMELGSFVGSALSLVAFRLFSAQKILISWLLLMAAAHTLTPLAGAPLITAACTFASGFGVGVIEIGSYVWLAGLWSDRVAPVIQLLHMCYGVGAFVAPLLAQPFLAHSGDLPLDDAENYTAADTLDVMNSTETDILNSSTNGVPLANAPFPSKVYIPYAMAGLFALSNAALMMVSFCLDSRDIRPQRPAQAGCKSGQTSLNPTRPPATTGYEWALATLTGFYTLLVVVVEVTVGKFLPTYAVRVYGMSRSAGAYALSLFYVGFTAARVVAVPVSLRLSPMQMMAGSQLGLVAAAVALAAAPHTSWAADGGGSHVMWPAAFVLGASLSPLFGSSTVWLSTNATLSHDLMSIIMTLAAFGALGPPLLVGSFLESRPAALTAAVLAGAVALTLVSCSMHATVHARARLYRRCPQSEPPAPFYSAAGIAAADPAGEDDVRQAMTTPPSRFATPRVP